MMKTACSVTFLALLATGCSTTRHCEREQPYQAAEMAETVNSVDGISPPSSPSALRIPEVAAAEESYAFEEPDPANPDKTRVRCLDVPPDMPKQPDA
ncbi:hypothetical protein [Polycyclovorans algicola]|uniref:hypothetical protein n=1 Tax=Polycyclovorans algicola TaxID=616992 RepID=UPI001268CE27|nr:hypothetical protein [Polycyclovorans algicola]